MVVLLGSDKVAQFTRLQSTQSFWQLSHFLAKYAHFHISPLLAKDARQR